MEKKHKTYEIIKTELEIEIQEAKGNGDEEEK
jgi:hypothetical protein